MELIFKILVGIVIVGSIIAIILGILSILLLLKELVSGSPALIVPLEVLLPWMPTPAIW